MLDPLSQSAEQASTGTSAGAHEDVSDTHSVAWLDANGLTDASHWVANVDARIVRLSYHGNSLPLLLDGPESAHNSYVAGARAAWLDYAVHEALRAHPARRQALLTGLAAAPLGLARATFAAAGFTRAAWLDNPLFSTQLSAAGLAANVNQWRQLAMQQAPLRPLFWRNVCADVEPLLPTALQADGWRLLPARLVYLCDPSSSALWKRNHVRRDHKLMRSEGVDWVAHEQLTVEDIPALRQCFRAVFFDKHSALNPDFRCLFRTLSSTRITLGNAGVAMAGPHCWRARALHAAGLADHAADRLRHLGARPLGSVSSIDGAIAVGGQRARATPALQFRRR